MTVWISSFKTVDVTAEVEVRLISIRTGKDRTGSPTQTSHWVRLVQCNNITDCGTHRLPVTKSPPEVDECDPYVVLATLKVDGQVLADDIAWPQPIKYLDLSDRRLSVTIDGTKAVVSAKNPVKGFVFDEVEGMNLSDNGFDVVPGLDRIVSVSVNTTASVSRLGYRYVGGSGSVILKP